MHGCGHAGMFMIHRRSRSAIGRFAHWFKCSATLVFIVIFVIMFCTYCEIADWIDRR